jgi:tetratricopeptide (TPR) repeat protein
MSDRQPTDPRPHRAANDDQPGDHDHDHAAEDESGALGDLLAAAVDELLRHQEPTPFLAWMKQSPALHPLVFSDAPTPEHAAVSAVQLGLALWNQFPLPAADYQPRPIQPTRNDRCPCGSGEKYKACCGRFGAAPEMLPLEAVWTLFLAAAPEHAPAVVEKRAVPRAAAAAVARYLLDEGEDELALGLVEPLFERPERAGERDAEALDVLLDAAASLDDPDDFDARVTGLAGRLRPVLRYVVWRHLLLSESDRTVARRLLARAREDVGRQLDLPLLEAYVLALEGQWDEAAAKASAAAVELRREGLEDDEPLLGWLDSAASDPRATFVLGAQGARDGAAEELLAWVRSLPQQAVTPITLVASGNGVALAEGAEIAAAAAAWQAAAEHDHDHHHEHEHEHEHAGHDHAHEHGDDCDHGLWAEDAPEAWAAFLTATPAAANSLSILAAVADAVDEMPEPTPWTAELFLDPLLERAAAILGPLLAREPAPEVVDGDADHLAHAACVLLGWRAIRTEARGDETAAAAQLRRVVAHWPQELDPRRELVAMLLDQGGADAEVVALTAALPAAENAPETRYGRVLALYRLGQKDEAAVALTDAVEHHPMVLMALINELADDEGDEAELADEADSAQAAALLGAADDEDSDHGDADDVDDLDLDDLGPDLPAAATAGDPANRAGAMVGLREAWRYAGENGDLWAAEPGLAEWLLAHAREVLEPAGE